MSKRNKCVRARRHGMSVPEDMPPSPPLRHRLVQDMEAVGEAKAEQASAEAARKLKEAECTILELESEISRMAGEAELQDARIDNLSRELERSEGVQSALNSKLSDVKAEAASAESLRTENDSLRVQNTELRRKVEAMSADQDSMEDLRRRLAIAENQRSKAMCMLNDAEDRMEFLRGGLRVNAEAEPCREPEQRGEYEVVRVTRTDRNCLSSPEFYHKCYSVKMNLAKTTMLITPSNDGKVLCRDYVLEISGLGHLLPFNGTEDLQAETVAGTKSIRITLGGS